MDESELVGLGVPDGTGVGEGPPVADGPNEGGMGVSADQLARLRAVLVAAHPEAVPELIGGDDLDTLLASVETARAAYARVKQAATQAALAAIPRGGGTRAPDPAALAGLSPEAKIAFALSMDSGR